MSVLIFIDQADGHVKKASLEVLSYGTKVAEQLGTTAEGVVLGTVTEDLAALGKYGIKRCTMYPMIPSTILMRKYSPL
ncbi:hypothetical protein [Paraflavitalea speifideaquila]|uniref:hypothetical protein n=1 Tax=Paraflavitalea speifideaquila TaxID=3076558 RepID=UPI0028EF6064|nr:hypothetical protein [Paraflavitalea speifideiaquila]